MRAKFKAAGWLAPVNQIFFNVPAIIYYHTETTFQRARRRMICASYCSTVDSSIKTKFSRLSHSAGRADYDIRLKRLIR
jgi:hypothetical protein